MVVAIPSNARGRVDHDGSGCVGASRHGVGSRRAARRAAAGRCPASPPAGGHGRRGVAQLGAGGRHSRRPPRGRRPFASRDCIGTTTAPSAVSAIGAAATGEPPRPRGHRLPRGRRPVGGFGAHCDGRHDPCSGAAEVAAEGVATAGAAPFGVAKGLPAAGGAAAAAAVPAPAAPAAADSPHHRQHRTLLGAASAFSVEVAAPRRQQPTRSDSSPTQLSQERQANKDRSSPCTLR